MVFVVANSCASIGDPTQRGGVRFKNGSCNDVSFARALRVGRSMMASGCALTPSMMLTRAPIHTTEPPRAAVKWETHCKPHANARQAERCCDRSVATEVAFAMRLRLVCSLFSVTLRTCCFDASAHRCVCECFVGHVAASELNPTPAPARTPPPI